MFSKVITAIVLCLVGSTAIAHAQGTYPVRLTTPDQVGIIGTYYTVSGKPAPAVLLLHALGTNRTEWASFAPLLQRKGIAVLSLDFRGHGESTRRLTAEGVEELSVEELRPRDFQDMLLDIEAAVSWLSEQPGIDRKRIGIVGSDLGANLAMRYATINEDTAALLLLSPGVNYKGVRTDNIASKVGKKPLRMVASRGDAFVIESCNRLAELREQAGLNVGENELIRCTGSLHGTEMLGSVKGLAQFLADWIQKTLSPKPAG